MKKLIVLLLALSMIGFAFAQDAAPAYTLAGDATVTWGYDLSTEAHGFVNAATFSLTFPLVAKATKANEGEGVYGSISFADFSLGATVDQDSVSALTGAGGAVTAKIMINTFYVQIDSCPDFAVNKAASFAPWVADEFDDNNGVVNYDGGSYDGGITIGMTGDLSFGLKIASVGSYELGSSDDVYTAVNVPVVVVADGDQYYFSAGEYVAYETDFEIPADTTYYTLVSTDTDGNTHGYYGMGVDVGYKLGDFGSVSATLVYGHPYDTYNLVIGLGAALTPFAGFTADVGMDYWYNSKIAKADATLVLGYTMAELFSAKLGVYAGMADFAHTDVVRADGQVRASLLAVPNLTLDVGVDLWDLLADPAHDPVLVMLGGKVAYKAMLDETNYAKPYLETGYEINDEVMALKVGVELGLIANTTITVDYTAGELATDNVTGGSSMDITTDGHKGVFTVACKITY